MHRYFCLLLLVLNPALASPVSKIQKTKAVKPKIIDIGEDRAFDEINKSLGDDIMVKTNDTESQIISIGEDMDMDEINNGDDIIAPKDIDQRSAVNNPLRLWSLPVAYVLHDSLDLNAKGVVLRALDQFRLKSCIDFKVKEDEKHYISVEKHEGCRSYIGQQWMENGQNISIGTFCDVKDTVEHEFLHALGFYHEQSRYDRDEYVTIHFENIKEKQKDNFRKVSKAESTTHRTPYDFMSVMHYGKNFFTNGNGPTITTKNPIYQDVIGQRLEMSPSDVKELNLLYKCKSSISFLANCSFSTSTCGMTNCSEGLSGWKILTSASGGPDSDHTNLKSYNNVKDPAPSSFMYASTEFGEEGNSSWLETERMTPGRSCPVQCLQFYYFHSGNESDQLNIWIREFRDEDDSEGQSRLVGQITGQRTTHWKYHHVSLSATKAFQVEFEARKGAGSSSGGFSIDDINMSELECPHVAIQIDDFETVMETSDLGTFIYSPRQYTNDGYAFRVAVVLLQSQYGLGIQLVEGKNDDKLKWPLLNRQFTFEALDQNPSIQLQMSKQKSITSDDTSDGKTAWDDPRTSGKKEEDENGEEMYVGPLIGRYIFGTLDELKQRDFIKGGSAVFVFSFQDITPLINGNSLPCAPPSPVLPSTLGSRLPCSSIRGSVYSALLIILSAVLLLFRCFE